MPLAVIEALWTETGGLDEDDAEDLVRRLGGLSLLQSLDLGRRTLRLHDNMLWYLRDKLGADGLKAAHAAMVRAIRAKCGGVWNTLPFDQTYGWRFLILHLRGADGIERQTTCSPTTHGLSRGCTRPTRVRFTAAISPKAPTPMCGGSGGRSGFPFQP